MTDLNLPGATGLVVQPGERLVFVTTRTDYTPEEVARVRAQLQEQFPGNVVAIVCGFDQVIKREQFPAHDGDAMTERAVLKAAVLKAIPDGTAIACHGDADRLADAIVDAVTTVAEQGVTVQWGARCVNNRCAAAGSIYHRHNSREKTVQSMAQAEDGHFELVRRQIWRSDWQAVT